MAETNLFDLMVLPASALRSRRLSKKHGHSAVPGSGPAGETCGGCKNFVRKEMSKTYFKCGIMRAYWTGGTGTDIRSRDKACRHWEAQADV